MSDQTGDVPAGHPRAPAGSTSAARAALGLALSQWPDDREVMRRIITACREALVTAETVIDPAPRADAAVVGPVSQKTLDRLFGLAASHIGPRWGISRQLADDEPDQF
jgi:hypothetical protein